MPGLSTCRECGAPIIWAHRYNKASKRGLMQINEDPDNTRGKLKLDTDDYIWRPYTPTEIDSKAPDTYPRYTSHFSTCPSANKYRRTLP